jgi:hypothetical protein
MPHLTHGEKKKVIARRSLKAQEQEPNYPDRMEKTPINPRFFM